MNAHKDCNGASLQPLDPEKEEALAFVREMYGRFFIGLAVAALIAGLASCGAEAVLA
mgnify:CR=1 FL=1